MGDQKVKKKKKIFSRQLSALRIFRVAKKMEMSQQFSLGFSLSF